MLDQMLKKYNIKNNEDYYNALKEILQAITLAGLYRADFFKVAAFYGGTALRIFYNLDRYSEDLDFSLLQRDDNFRLEPYFKAIKDEFEALGIKIQIDSKEKKINSAVKSAFLKSDTTIHILSLQTTIHLKKQIKIKFEIDTNPPLDFDIEQMLLLQPFSFFVKCYESKDLYAGKMHALLYRNWKTRVKGRDWYDFEWYVRNNFNLNLNHLTTRARQSNNLENNESFTQELLIKTLKEKIDSVDIENAKIDIRRFISDDKVLDIWSKDYFKLLVDKIQFC